MRVPCKELWDTKAGYVHLNPLTSTATNKRQISMIYHAGIIKLPHLHMSQQLSYFYRCVGLQTVE